MSTQEADRLRNLAKRLENPTPAEVKRVRLELLAMLPAPEMALTVDKPLKMDDNGDIWA